MNGEIQDRAQVETRSEPHHDQLSSVVYWWKVERRQNEYDWGAANISTSKGAAVRQLCTPWPVQMVRAATSGPQAAKIRPVARIYAPSLEAGSSLEDQPP
mgnify:FL=1